MGDLWVYVSGDTKCNTCVNTAEISRSSAKTIKKVNKSFMIIS